MGSTGLCRSLEYSEPPVWRTTARALLVLLALLTTGQVSAEESDPLRFSGFGTFGYTADNRSNAAPTRDIAQMPHNGFSTGDTWLVDSRVGVQLEYSLNPTVDLVGQVVFRDHFKADLNSSTELAYVALKPLAHVDIRAGRINYDAFLMSDYRNVGYAYQWIRPPTEFYGWIPIFSIDGADVAYSIRNDDAHWRIKAQAGSSRISIPIGDGYKFKTNNLMGASISRQSSSWRLKAAYSQFTVGPEVPFFAQLHQGLDALTTASIAQVSAEAADLRRNLAFKGAKISYTTLGAAYDDGTWLGQAEVGHSTSTADVIPNSSMAYIGLGRRIGDWTPHLLLSTSRPNKGIRAAAADWGAFNATLRAPALFVVNATRIEQNTVSIGARWDFRRQAALKLQWDHTVIKPQSYGLWWRDLAINNQASRINQISATLDFTF